MCRCWELGLCVTVGEYGLEKMKLAIFMFGFWGGYGVEERICDG